MDDTEPDPRTAIGINQNGRYIYLIVIDGRQPFYSSGATFLQLAELMKKQGAYFAMALDGGGSSTMVIEGEIYYDEIDIASVLVNADGSTGIRFRIVQPAFHLPF